MSVTIQPLFEPTVLAGSTTLYYTAGGRTRIDKMTVSNPDAAVHMLTVYLVPSGQRANAYNQLINQRPIQPLETWDVDQAIGHSLVVGDTIWAMAEAPNFLVLFCSGSLVSS